MCQPVAQLRARRAAIVSLPTGNGQPTRGDNRAHQRHPWRAAGRCSIGHRAQQAGGVERRKNWQKNARGGHQRSPKAAQGSALPAAVLRNGSRMSTLQAAQRIQLAVGPQPLWLRDHNSGLAQRIMVKRLATSPHDPLGITDSACKNQSAVVSVRYGPFNPYIPIRSTTIGKSRVARDPIAMHTSWRSE
ncbi:hypothetical protein F511_30118 [Dorcoceras hygrometricum]|uniref:Uncharacterized protein n=1 Tax=Dorcoceras hygrometricum TaxID=472368 RepID=A0A2Z7AFL2_9LAMI|nr:hypothetical protein F511_30118 [Dorcoceras hygrometricum]